MWDEVAAPERDERFVPSAPVEIRDQRRRDGRAAVALLDVGLLRPQAHRAAVRIPRGDPSALRRQQDFQIPVPVDVAEARGAVRRVAETDLPAWERRAE